MEKLQNMIKHIFYLFGLGVLLSCTDAQKEIITFIDVPTGENSSEPNLHLSESGDIYLNWLETDGNN